MQKLSDCELRSLRIIWDYEKQNISPSLRDIVAEYNARYRKNESPLATQTVSTFLIRLVRKGYITPQREGRFTLYSHVISSIDYQKLFLYETLELFYGEKVDVAMDALKNI